MVNNMPILVLIIMKSATVVAYSMDLNEEQNHWVTLSSKILNYVCEPGVSQEGYRALMVTLCHVFGAHRSSYRYWKTVLKNQTADRLYYAVRYLSHMASATVRPEQEASPQWQPGEVTRWDAGLLAGS